MAACPFLSRRRPGKLGQTKGGGGGDPGRARSRSDIHNPSLPSRGRERRCEFHVDARALLCRHAQGGSAGGITSAGTRAAIVSVGVGDYSCIKGGTTLGSRAD